MEQLKNTLYSIAVVAVLAGVFNLFSTSNKLKKYTSYAVSLAITISILSPLKSFLTSPDSFDLGLSERVYEEDTQTNTITVALQHAITKNISDYFSIPGEAFSVGITIDQNASEHLITSIYVTMKDKKYFPYTERIKAYLKSNFGCEITVTQHFEE